MAIVTCFLFGQFVLVWNQFSWMNACTGLFIVCSTSLPLSHCVSHHAIAWVVLEHVACQDHL